jgi:hypothetical protein
VKTTTGHDLLINSSDEELTEEAFIGNLVRRGSVSILRIISKVLIAFLDLIYFIVMTVSNKCVACMQNIADCRTCLRIIIKITTDRQVFESNQNYNKTGTEKQI